MHKYIHRPVTLLRILLLLLGLARSAVGEGTLVEDVTTSVGKFGGTEYVRHTGRLIDSAGQYRVPYEIVTPSDSSRGNSTVLVELSHFVLRTQARDYLLGPEFLFGQGFSYGAVGWGGFIFPGDFTILDPTATDVFVNAGVSGAAILKDFTKAVRRGPFGMAVTLVYSFGHSQTAMAEAELIFSNEGAGLFDFSIIGGLDTSGLSQSPQKDAWPVIEFRSEADIILAQGQALRTDDAVHGLFRIYEFAGMPHIPGGIYGAPELDWTPFARALFQAGHLWATKGKQPPASVYLAGTGDSAADPVYGFFTGIARGEWGNALGGIRAPDLALGRGQFLAADFQSPVVPGYVGAFYEQKDSLEFRARFPNHGRYVSAFEHQLEYLLNHGLMLESDAKVMLKSATNSDVGE